MNSQSHPTAMSAIWCWRRRTTQWRSGCAKCIRNKWEESMLRPNTNFNTKYTYKMAINESQPWKIVRWSLIALLQTPRAREKERICVSRIKFYNYLNFPTAIRTPFSINNTALYTQQFWHAFALAVCCVWNANHCTIYIQNRHIIQFSMVWFASEKHFFRRKWRGKNMMQKAAHLYLVMSKKAGGEMAGDGEQYQFSFECNVFHTAILEHLNKRVLIYGAKYLRFSALLLHLISSNNQSGNI